MPSRRRTEKLTITIRRADYPDGTWFVISEWTPENGVPRQTISQIDDSAAHIFDEATAWQIGRDVVRLCQGRLI